MDEAKCTSIEIAAAAEVVLKTPPPPELVELVEKNAIEAVDDAKKSFSTRTAEQNLSLFYYSAI